MAERKSGVAATRTLTYRVTSVIDAGLDRVTVNMSQLGPTDPATGIAPVGNLAINLSNTDATGYFPGQNYTVTIAAETTA